jgi:hypothetical protein
MSVTYGFGASLRKLMTDDAAVTAMVGTRIFPGLLPQRADFPAVVYGQISSERVSAMGQDTGTVRSIWQIDCYAKTYGSARELASKVRKSLQRKLGSVAIPSNGAKLLQGLFVEADTDLFEDETQLHRVSTDYVIWYVEAGE